MKYVTRPNLPENDVTTAIVSGEISKECENTLNMLGVCVIKTKPHPKLYNAVKQHPDMIIHHLGDNNICIEPTAMYAANSLPNANVCSGKSIGREYPYDISYNAARVGGYLICNRRFTESIILENAIKSGVEIIDVKQGYAKCNICVISENAIITSDKGIAEALRNISIDVLFIDDSAVKLKNFSHGFFGGATGKIAPDKIVVNGNIKFHKSGDEIMDFTKKYGIEIISLNDNQIEDIGSILPILEKEYI